MGSNVAVLGTGYVGLIQSIGLADFGNHVTGVDLRPEIVDQLLKAIPPIFEHGLSEYLERNVSAGRLSFTTDAQSALRNADVVFITVGTPERSDGTADLGQVQSVGKDIAEHCAGFTVVVTKSTVPVGTNRLLAHELRGMATGDREFVVVSNPEFLREGKAVQDFFHPDRVVLGFEDPDAEATQRGRDVMEELYRPLYLISTPFIWTTFESAELAKYAANAFLATKVTFINQVAELCEKTGADVHTIARAMGMDGRIGPKFLHPGPGYGGSCFPKDTKALVATGRALGVDMSIVGQVILANEQQKIRTAERVVSALGGVRGKRISILGVAFKAETDDVRDSPALLIARHLADNGAEVHIHDPKAQASFLDAFGHAATGHADVFSCLSGSDCALVLTEWNEYRNLDLSRARVLMNQPIIVDARNVLDPEDALAAGFEYYGVGRGKPHARRT